VFNSSSSAHLRGMQQPGVRHINPPPGVRAQVPQPFLPPQATAGCSVSCVASCLLEQCMLFVQVNPMFPPQLSPQHLAMLSGIHPHVQQVQLAYQLLMQQQQQQQQHFLSHRKFSHVPPVHQDPQQVVCHLLTL
ncbi:trinucleotide repeat-containing gene 6B protein-like isoform X1, partial [Tachysurus ichikawai]